MKGRAPERSLVKKAGSEEPVYNWVKDRVLISRSQISSVQGSTHPLPPRSLMNREGCRRALTPDHSPDRHPGAQLPVSPPPSRRSPSYIVCNTTSSDEVLEMKVTVQVDILLRETGMSGHFVGRIKGAKYRFDLQYLTWDFS